MLATGYLRATRSGDNGVTFRVCCAWSVNAGGTHRGQVKTSRFTRYFISSSWTDVERHMEFARSHWKIENCLHWIMDVTFREDACRVRAGHEAQNLATLRRCAAFLLKQCGEGTMRTSVRGRKKSAGWSRAYLLRVLTS